MRPLVSCVILASLPLLLLLAPLKPVGASADSIRSISAAAETACAIRGDGALLCWGDNRSGQVGVGHVSDKEPNPVQVIATGVTAVAVGYAHACAVADGGLLCWGWNSIAQIGTHRASQAVTSPALDRSVTAVLTPTRVIDRGVTAVAAGGMHTCAIVDGALQCWGDNSFGEIGNGATGSVVLEPARIFDAGMSAVSAQSESTCAIVRGALWCWGDNRAGQVGNGASGKPVALPFKVIDHGVTAVAVGNNYACAIVARALQCWGAVREGRMSETPKPGDLMLKPEVVIADNVAAVAAGHSHACAIVGSVLECWGYSSNGNIRSGYPVTVPAPEPIIASGVTSVAAGSSVTCAIVDGALRCRGYNGYGTALTVGRAQDKAFDFAGGDLHTLDASAANAAAARARLPGEVARYLVGKLVTDGKLTYVVTRAGGTLEKDIYDRDIFMRMKLDVVALYALQVPPSANDFHGVTPIDATIPADATCDLESERTSHLTEHVPFSVLKDDRFIALNLATDGLFAKLPPPAAGELPPHPLRLNAADLARIQTCASDALSRIDQQPVIDLYAGDKLITRVPATPADSWTYPEKSSQAVSKIVIEPKTGSAADYTINVRVFSSMRCGDLMLWNWQQPVSIPWQLQRAGNAFDVYRTPLESEAPTFPAYSAAELRAAIDDARHVWEVKTEVDPASCVQVLSGETYSIQKGTQLVKEIGMVYADPTPIVPFNCDDGERPSLAVHVASDLGYPVPDWDSKMQCKALPDQPGASIVALSYPEKGTEDPEYSGTGDYDLDISIVDMPTRRVLARNVRKNAFTSDAWRFNGIQIDTGRYRLATDVRAFGVRANSGASSHYSPAEDTTLSLYVRHGKQLREVLGGLLVHSVRGEGNDNCTGTSSTLDRTIDIAPSTSHGLADLILTSSVTASEGSKGDDDCKSIEHAPEVTHTTLRYDGTKYVIPAGLDTFP